MDSTLLNDPCKFEFRGLGGGGVMIFAFARYLKRAIPAALLAFFANASHAADLSVPVVSGWNLLGNTAATAINPTSVPELFDVANVTTLWKWNSQNSSWVFYAPRLASDGTLAAYASGKGYQVLTSIAPGEGFWVNAVRPFTLSRTGISTYSLGASSLVKGWNLVASGEALSPAQLDSKLGGSAAAASFSTMWAWNAADSRWYFHAPSLAANGALAAYVQSKGYQDFGALTTGNGLGFWLNSNVAAPQFDGVVLTTVNNTDQVTIAWLEARDSATPPSQIKYNVHLSTTPEFTPSSDNLKQSVTGVKQAVITGLSAGTTYHVLVLAVNSDGRANSGRKYVPVTTMKDPFIYSSVRRLYDAKSNGLVRLADPSVGLRYRYTGTEPLPKEGDVFIAEDGGVLALVYSVSIVGNELIVTFFPGSVSAYVHQGAVTNRLTLFDPPVSSSADANSAKSRQLRSAGVDAETRTDTNGRNTVEWQDRLLKFEETTNPNKAAGLLIERNSDTGRYLIKAAPPRSTNNLARALTGSASDEFSYDVGVTFTPELTTDIQWSTFGTRIVKAEVIASGTLSLDAEAIYNFAAAADFKKDYTFDVFTRKWTSVYQMGTVPVYQEITFTLGASLNAHAYGAIKASTSANVSQTVQFGVRYNTDSGAWEAIAPSTSREQSVTADLSTKGSVSSEIRLIPNIEVKFYKAVAVNLSVEPVISGEFNTVARGEGMDDSWVIQSLPPGTNSTVERFNASLNAQCFVGAELRILNSNLPLMDKTKVCDIPAYSFFSLPLLKLNGSRLENGTYSMVAEITDGDNNKFNDASIKWSIDPASTGTIADSGRSATFTPTCDETKSNTTVYFSGYGVLRELGRQYTAVRPFRSCPSLYITQGTADNSLTQVKPGATVRWSAGASAPVKVSGNNVEFGSVTIAGLTWSSDHPEVTVLDGLITASRKAPVGQSVRITVTDPLTKAAASATMQVVCCVIPE